VSLPESGTPATAGFLIVCTDEADLLEHSLPAALAEGFRQALVLDNGSNKRTRELSAQHGAECLSVGQRLPYTEAMNLGLRELRTDAVALLQADTFVSPGYLEACLQALAAPGVGSVAPKLLRTAGPRDADRLALIDAAGMSLDRRRKNGLVGHGAPAAEYATPSECFGADGAAAMYRREALQDCSIGGQVFDEQMPGWACDADLAWRMRLLGWSSRYEPHAIVHHIRTYSPTTRARMSAVDRRTQFRNRYLMIAKNDSLRELGRDLGPLLFYELLAFGYALLREPELLRGYLEALQRLPAALRWRRQIQARRRVSQVPFGLTPSS
jgi:GT2 family glycosyltransferase